MKNNNNLKNLQFDSISKLAHLELEELENFVGGCHGDDVHPQHRLYVEGVTEERCASTTQDVYPGFRYLAL